MSAPPFSNLTAYATRLQQEVPDTKPGYTLTDYVAAALERYSEDNPAEEAQEAARQKALSDAKCHTFEEALIAVSKYVGLWLSDQIDAEAAMDEIETIITANLGPRS